MAPIFASHWRWKGEEMKFWGGKYFLVFYRGFKSGKIVSLWDLQETSSTNSFIPNFWAASEGDFQDFKNALEAQPLQLSTWKVSSKSSRKPHFWSPKQFVDWEIQLFSRFRRDRESKTTKLLLKWVKIISPECKIDIKPPLKRPFINIIT